MTVADRRKFSAPRYATRGIADELDPVIQQEIWLMIEVFAAHLGPDNVDYLQVFDLEPAEDGEYLNQALTHRQEVPSYSATNRIQVDSPVRAKVFVIDDETHCTMLFSHEY